MNYRALIVATCLVVLGCTKEAPPEPVTPAPAPCICPTEVGDPGPTAHVPEVPSGEGMWPWESLEQLDERELRERGLRLPLAELWTRGEGGLFRAVAGLRGCTASFVSADGLLITNHHCAFSAIQRNSTPERNLLEEGFLAPSRAEELDGHGIRVQVFQRMTDVTAAMRDGAPTEDDLARALHLEAREKSLVATCEETPATRCAVNSFNDGRRYVLSEYLELRDVRLVAAPPAALGEYGGEVDNWHWPRHTLDFAFLRAYVGPDGKPAAFDAANVPYPPEHHLQINPQGLHPGDFAMVVGTPYWTVRYRTALAIEGDLEWYYPRRLELFGSWLDLLAETCTELPESCLPTATTRKSLSNGLTNARGMIVGLERSGVLRDRRHQEASLRVASTARLGEVREALAGIEAQVRAAARTRDRDFLLRYWLRGSQALGFARTITKFAAEGEKPDAERDPGFQERDRELAASQLEQAQRSLHTGADERVFAFFVTRLCGLPPAERVPVLDAQLRGDCSAESATRFARRVYAGTRLVDAEERLRLFEANAEALRESGDTMIQLALDLGPLLDDIEDAQRRQEGAMTRLRPVYVDWHASRLGSRFYPDANATPRVSFATVAGYSPRDGLRALPFTTLDGLVAKGTGQAPFAVPATVREAVERGDAGAYGRPEDGSVPACFLTNADTTGGNSGSPVLDGNGHLVGLNFDRVYENIAGDYRYSPQTSRNISVDVRAILWYLDRIAKAEELLRELTP